MNKPSVETSHFPGPGFRINYNFNRPNQELISRLARFHTADISDHMNGFSSLRADIKSQFGPTGIAGPACTVKLPTGDNLMLHKALEIAKPGDILVVDVPAESANAVCGEMVARKARHLGIGGIVIDGMIRDSEALLELGLPIFAKGITSLGPKKEGPGEVNYPICCGRIVIAAGDIIVGDSDGIVAIRQQDAAFVADKLEEWLRTHEEYAKAVAAGRFDFNWVNRILGKA